MITQPIFIIGAPRSGTSILFRSLSMHADLWHLPRESHAVFEGPFHPRCGFESNRITADNVTLENTKQVRDGFEQRVLNLGVLDVDAKRWLTDRSLVQRLRNRIALKWFTVQSRKALPNSFRLLEKTPKNSLRVSALAAMFPNARFVFLQRNAAQNVDSLLAGWRAVDRFGPIKRHRFCASGYAVTDQLELADYDGPRWKFALVPNWQRFQGRTCADIAAAQYFQCNQVAETDLAVVNPDRVFRVGFDEFIAEPVDLTRRILDWAELDRDDTTEAFTANLPRVNDATPNAKRKHNQLRFPNEVHAAIEPWLQHGTDGLRHAG